MNTGHDDSVTVRTTSPNPLDPKVVSRKVEQFFELCEMAKELALEGIKHRHPEASPAELRRLFAERLAVFREGEWRRHGCGVMRPGEKFSAK
jgi:hypothetical protein